MRSVEVACEEFGVDEAYKRDLRTEIAKGNVLAIIGAGTSIAATKNAPATSWIGLLKEGVTFVEKYCGRTLPRGWGKRQLEALQSCDIIDLLGVAEQIESRLDAPKGGEYRRWLRHCFADLRVSDRRPIEALHHLGVQIATTNYDDLIEQVTGLQPITRLDDNEIMRFARRESNDVLHLHGIWKRSETVVLGVRSYEILLRDLFEQAIQQALAVTRTLLFIGFGGGLTDPNFQALLEWLRVRFKGQENRHYRLIREQDFVETQFQHQADERITILPYGKEYSDLIVYLRDLAPSTGLHSTPRLAATPEPLPARGLCVGRDNEVESIVTSILAENPPPIPILGGPGIGKTTVCRAVLHDPRVAKRYRQRRFFARLDGATTAEEVAAAVAQSLGLPVGPQSQAAIFDTLAEAKSALALDNVETPLNVPDPRPTEELLCRFAEVPGIALLLTIRGTAYPPGVRWRQPAKVGQLNDGNDRDMFLTIAGGRFENDPDLESFLGNLDGWPLAIELAAYAAQGQPSLHLLTRRWERERAKMLARGSGDHRLLSVEASAELSINAPSITTNARRLLGLLGVLPDGLRLNDLSTLVPPKAEQAASALLQAALVFEEAGRLHMLSPLREHVAARHPPTTCDITRLVKHYATLVTEHGRRAGQPGGDEAVALLAPELANIDFALRNGLNGAYARQVSIAVQHLSKFQRYSGLGTTTLLDYAAAAMRREGDVIGEADCIRCLGELSQARMEHDDARRHYERALSLYKGNTMREAQCIRHFGEISLACSEYQKAKQYFLEALSLYRSVCDALGEPDSMVGLGNTSLALSEHREAQNYFEDALPLFQSVGDILGEANCLKGLGDVSLARSDYDGACARFNKALTLYNSIGVAFGEAECLRFLGTIALKQSDTNNAQQYLRKALSIFRRLGNVQGQENCFTELRAISDQ